MAFLRGSGSPASSSLPPQQILHAHQPPILPHHASPQYHHLSPAPNPPALPAFSTAILNPPTVPRDDQSSPASSTSRLEALATLASQPSPQGHGFASRLHAPIQALADAADELNGKEGGSGGDNGQGESAEGERPKKRSRVAVASAFSASPSNPSFDVVAKGIISDQQGRLLVSLCVAVVSTCPSS